MGLLNKLKAVLGLSKPPAKQASQNRSDKNRQGNGRRSARPGRGAPTRSRSAKPRNGNPGEGANAPEGARKPRNPQGNSERRPRPEGGTRPQRPPRGNGEGGRRNSERRGGERADRGNRNTPSGAERPGGALTEAQIQANAAAHAAWDPSSYQVPEAEGKKRFVDFGLPGEILHAVADLGFQYCTPIQAQSLEFSLAGKNVAGRAQTGTGKTAAFLIAVLTRYLRTPEKRNMTPGTPRALILAPTRELVIQICKDAEALGKYCGGVRSLAVYGGMDYDRQRRELEEAPVDLLVATPGRLKDYVRNRIVDLRQVDTLVIDEADRMLDMGFIPDVRAIVNRLPDRDHRCTMLYSATLNETVMNLAGMWMRDPVRVEIESESLATDTVRQIVYIARAEEKFTLLYNHLKRNEGARTIIFCNRKFSTERIAENLRRRGIPCEVLSGDVSQVRRLKILDAFRAGSVRTVVATDVAGRGIHVDDIAFVVNYDFPYEPEDYVHRIGRTGRAGHSGTAISFADEDESFIIPDIEAYINEPLKCTMPEEWMFEALPAPAPLRRKGRRDREEKPTTAPAPEGASTPAPQAESTPEKAESTPEKAESAPEKAEPAPAQPEVQRVTEEVPAVSAKAVEETRPERTPRFKPHGSPEKAQTSAPDSAQAHPPRQEKPVARRWARTQADGPRDGSESHHAAPTISRPIYAPGRRGPVAAEWSPGQDSTHA